MHICLMLAALPLSACGMGGVLHGGPGGGGLPCPLPPASGAPPGLHLLELPDDGAPPSLSLPEPKDEDTFTDPHKSVVHTMIVNMKGEQNVTILHSKMLGLIQNGIYP